MHQRAQATNNVGVWLIIAICVQQCAAMCSNKNLFQLHAPSGVTSIRIVDRCLKLLSCCMIRSCCCKQILNKIMSLFVQRREMSRSCISVHKPSFICIWLHLVRLRVLLTDFWSYWAVAWCVHVVAKTFLTRSYHRFHKGLKGVDHASACTSHGLSSVVTPVPICLLNNRADKSNTF